MAGEKRGIIVCVCGGRDFTDQRAVSRALNRLHALNVVRKVVHGGAPGADTCAGNWAQARRILCVVYAADWAAHRRAAGPLRNQFMLEHAKPDCVLEFPGGRGTADTVRRAQRMRILVIPAEVVS